MNVFEITYSLNEIDVVAKSLYHQFGKYKIWTLAGDLGSGKTTLIQSVCKYLQVIDVVNSPSFSIVQEYQTLGRPVYHIDLYRLKNFEDAINIGIEEILESHDFCFIEWAQILSPLLQNIPHLQIKINRENETLRKLQAMV